ncbi:MAG: secretin N-terminal domain-containing protein, partial [Phycisphaerae bacterium]
MLRPDSRNIWSQWVLATMCMMMVLPMDLLAANRTVIASSVTDDYRKPPASQESEQLQKNIEERFEAARRAQRAREEAADRAQTNQHVLVSQPLTLPGEADARSQELQRIRAELRGERPAQPSDTATAAVRIDGNDTGEAVTLEPQQTPPADTPPDPAANPESTPANEIGDEEAAAQAATQPSDDGAEQGDEQKTAAQRAIEDARRAAAARNELVGPPAYYKNQNLRRDREAAQEQQPVAANTEENTAPEAIEVPTAQAVIDRDGKTEWFNFIETPWEDVIKHFAERLDKPVIGLEDLIFGSDLTYVNPKKFTLDEAIDELNYLMQIEGYRFVETENHIKVIPLAEMPFNVPLDRIYATRAAYEADKEAGKLRRMDYVTVHYLVPDQSAQLLVDTFGGMLPDYARCSVLGDTNKIKLVGTVQDIDKFFDLIGRIQLEPHDPRKYEVIKIETNAESIEQIVRDILELPDTSTQINPRVLRNRRGQPQQLEESDAELPVRVTADERTNSLIIYATQVEIDRVKELVEKVDIKPPLGEFRTRVVKIEYADATEVANLMMEIFRQEQGDSGQPGWQRQQQLTARQRIQQARARARNRNQPNQQQEASPESIISEGLYERAKKTVRIAADDRTNSLLIYANDEGQKRVDELLQIIDVPVPSNFQTFVIQNTDAAKIYPTIEQIVQGLGSFSTRGARRNTQSRVVLDAGSNALHVVAEREDMIKIEEIIQELDVAGTEQIRHVIYLENLKPSEVAPTVQALLAEQSATSSSNRGNRGRFRRGGSRGGAVVNVEEAQVIALDEAKMLIVVCDEEDWTQVEQTIQEWDGKAISDTPVFASYELKNGDATQIAQTLETFYRNYQHPVIGSSPVLVAPEGKSILVQAIQPAQEEIQALIVRLDVEDIVAIEVLALQHADASDVAEQLQRLFGDSSTSSSSRRRGRGPVSSGAETIIEAEPSTNSIIVKADPAVMEEIKDFALAQDMRVAALVPERRFYTLNFAKPRDVVSAINGLFGGGSGSRMSRGRSAASNSQVTAIEMDRQVIVEAPPEKQSQIADFITQLDSPEGREIVTTLVKMPGAQVSAIARTLAQAFQDQVRNSGITAEFVPDTTTETILISASKSIMPEVEARISEYKELTSDLVMQRVFRKLVLAPADEAAQWLQPQLQASVTTLLGSNAARQVQVTPDMRTGRIVIYAPSVAVKEAMQMLEDYDIEVANPTPPDFMVTETKDLPGLDVQNLARNLDTAFGNRTRPDRLRARFTSDALTETIIYTVPKDWKDEVDSLIAKFAGKADEINLVQQFYVIQNADATYVAQKINESLLPRLRRQSASMAERVTVTVDDRANRVVVNAPAVIHESVKPFIEEIDIPADSGAKLRTVKLENANAPDANNILQQVFRDKIQKEKRLQVSVDAVTNSIIIRGSDEDYQLIADWLRELDESAITSNMVTEVFPLKNVANPWEVVNVLNQRYQQTGVGRRNAVGTEVKFLALGDTSVVAVAPSDKMAEIRELIAVIDDENTATELPTELIPIRFADPNEVANVINQVYGQGTGSRNRQTQNMRVTVANQTLVVKAPKSDMEAIRRLVEQVDVDEATDNLAIQSFSLDLMDASTVA